MISGIYSVRLHSYTRQLFHRAPYTNHPFKERPYSITSFHLSFPLSYEMDASLFSRLALIREKSSTSPAPSIQSCRSSLEYLISRLILMREDFNLPTRHITSTSLFLFKKKKKREREKRRSQSSISLALVTPSTARWLRPPTAAPHSGHLASSIGMPHSPIANYVARVSPRNYTSPLLPPQNKRQASITDVDIRKNSPDAHSRNYTSDQNA